MKSLRMACGGLALLAVVGCGSPPGGAPRPAAQETAPSQPAQPDVASLPRSGVTLQDRAAWRHHLNWPNDCEDAFQASHAGNDGGLLFETLAGGGSLVEVTCAAGSYQPSTVRLRLVESSTGLVVTPLAFPVYVSEDGRQLALSRQTEVWGASDVDGARQTLTVLTLSRQTGDCGVWTRYSLTDAEPQVLAAAARVPCPFPPGPPATLSASGPPPGWAPVPRKD